MFSEAVSSLYQPKIRTAEESQAKLNYFKALKDELYLYP